MLMMRSKAFPLLAGPGAPASPLLPEPAHPLPLVRCRWQG
jgi:hypothetical protein